LDLFPLNNLGSRLCFDVVGVGLFHAEEIGFYLDISFSPIIGK